MFDSKVFFFNHQVYDDYGNHKISFAFKYLHLFISSSTDIREMEEQHSWFLNVKDWKYTGILQQWSFTYSENCMEHIRLHWQACRILDGTYKRNQNAKISNTMSI
jgi:hypothetical protein